MHADDEAERASYLKAHGRQIEQFLETFIEELVTERPADPLSFLATRVSTFRQDEGDEGDEGDEVESLRKQFLRTATALNSSSSCLRERLELQSAQGSLRSHYLRPLSDLIPPPPMERQWQDEWMAMCLEQNRWLHDEGKSADPELLTEAGILKRDGIDVVVNKFTDEIEERSPLASRGGNWGANGVGGSLQWDFTREEAEAFTALMTKRRVLARSVRERDACYAASVYKLQEVLWNVLSRFQDKRQDAGEPLYAPLCYRHLTGPASLAEADPMWEHVEEYDINGFRGLTSGAVIEAWRNPECFDVEGYRHCFRTRDCAPGTYKYREPSPGAVVQFVSQAGTEFVRDGLIHTGIPTDAHRVCFPPHTLFRLREIKEPGTWTVEGVPGVDVKMNQRLLVMTATYRPPPRPKLDPLGQAPTLRQWASSRHVGHVMNLRYGDRESYVNGIEDITAHPVLTMAQEFEREYTFVDSRGGRYTLAGEWKYVNGPAARKEGCSAGTGVRDGEHDGWTLDRFCDVVNAHVKARREAGHGIGLREERALLTRDEVLSVRLYTGPCYQVINDFLRQIGPLKGPLRIAMATHPSHTFAATVGHICAAIRKLAAIATPEEAERTLWRGVRGQLERGFFEEDALGMVAATDVGFMSTSCTREIPERYMHGPANVLWKIRAARESDAAFHYGADVRMLSQFSEEEEILFPPCTMLEVDTGSLPGGREAAVRGRRASAAVQQEIAADGFVELTVTPSYI